MADNKQTADFEDNQVTKRPPSPRAVYMARRQLAWQAVVQARRNQAPHPIFTPVTV